MAGGVSNVFPQSSKRIEQFAPELEKIISTSEPIQELAEGFGGALGPAEGPVWWKEGRYLLFSDIHNNQSYEVCSWTRRVRVPGADEPSQWADQRPPGPLAGLRA